MDTKTKDTLHRRISTIIDRFEEMSQAHDLSLSEVSNFYSLVDIASGLLGEADTLGKTVDTIKEALEA